MVDRLSADNYVEAGVGAAAIMPLSLTLLAAAVPATRRAMAIGVWGGVSGLGIALGPVIGGAVVDGFSWEAIFWLNVPIALIAVPLILRALPESYGRRIVNGFTPLEAGIRTLPWTAAPMIVAPLAGLLAPRVGVRVLLGLGLTLQSLGLVWLALVTDAATPYAELVPGFVLAGIGMGLTFAPSATAVLADMAPDDHATASPAGYDVGLQGAILAGAAIIAVGAVSTRWLPRHPRVPV